MERLTDKHFNKSLGYYMKCSGCCERSIACNECEEFEALVDRIGAIEEILGDDYDLDYLRNLANQRMTMREDVAERMKLVGGIPIERLRELVEADRDGRCVVLNGKDKKNETIRDLVKVLKWISDSVINHDFSPFRIVTGAPENTFPVVRQYQRVTDKYEEEIYLAFKDEEAGNYMKGEQNGV